MRRTISLILMIVVTAALAMTACSSSGSPVGFWVIDKVTADDVEMNAEDAKSIGLTAVGSVKLQKSGGCELKLLGEEYTGKWELAKDGTITIKYDEEMTLTGKVNDKGVMKLTDPQGTEYELSK